ncbi:GNAT family N-acetyltransferase [Ruminococcaceae bacterium OttesenSCG-928-A16]|nr:GNAT family N-acetyltransferase [Ruminococcaceae bacterium OttesenSCG-928-A16]
MPIISTSIPNFSLRFATRHDVPLVLGFIQKLALYEKRPQDVHATEQILADSLFNGKYAEVLLAEYEGETVGYALFYPVFSSFAGVPSLYVEDLFINPTLRGKGLGKETLRQLAKLAQSRGCPALKWSCLDWNQPSIDFYLHLGATIQNGNTSFALQGQALNSFAGNQ